MAEQTTICDVEMPERIWLLDLGCGEVTWCNDPEPDREATDSVAYIRADRIEAMSRQLVEYRGALERISKSDIGNIATLHPVHCATIARKALEGSASD